MTPCYPMPAPYGNALRCADCHRAAKSPKCHACKLPTFERCVSAFNVHWHMACFKCKACRHPIKGQEYVVHQGCAYDEDCYHHTIQKIDMENDPAK
ncbi:LIM zinc-binding domain-containing protein [Caenorhabditis elegans]|nr:LIM zinc-binding domain-containing protein [Caenorhabditis elegans]CDK13566.1 LIM zinc-binding domain-containing protein [Caenorhabditis elegans]|eukprot:NP_001293248.1 Uncharacterized protein CELE_Y65B4A.7 [Caenorhabditis elegans]